MTLRPAAAPCASCPYRRDVPSGVWAPEEYDKLAAYDRPTMEQPFGLFMCHQLTGAICAGWLGCHDRNELLALRFASVDLHPSVFDYKSPVPLFSSGAEARAHGLADVDEPGEGAERMMQRLARKRVIRARRYIRRASPPVTTPD